MALRDFETFIRERLLVFNASFDVTPGSPIDSQVIQPILRRLGTDPFTVDLPTFMLERISQELPDLAVGQADAVTDLLIKPATLLWDAIVRELQRIKQSQSFKNPELLTVEEASALGSNLFATMRLGEVARGVARIYYAAPQKDTISPDNFVTSRSGLHFYPNLVQTITADQMQLNKEGNYYYFDINVVAEQPGDAYNIEPKELVSIANVSGAVFVTNKNRFRYGQPAENPSTFIGRIDQDLGERSMVTTRGIVSRLERAFSDITRIAVVGHNDPEMQRDRLEGGGYGPILASGSGAQVVPDGQGEAKSRYVQLTDAPNLLGLVGPPQLAVSGFVLTLVGAFGGVTPYMRDLNVTRIISADTLEVELQELAYPSPIEPTKIWALRRKTLTLSKIPGGIVLPNGVNGTLEIEDGAVHVGGASDIYVRSAAFDQASLTIANLVDDNPALSGVSAIIQNTTSISLTDLQDGLNFTIGDATTKLIDRAIAEGWTLQIDNGPAAGSYQLIAVSYVPGGSPLVDVSTPLPAPLVGGWRWRLFDVLDVDLTSPRETKITGIDLQSVANSSIVTTAVTTSFSLYGVSQGDVLVVETGPDAGEWTITEDPQPPFYASLVTDHIFSFTTTGMRYRIIRKNVEGGVRLPFVRVRDVQLLDTTGQPVGTTIPYGRPVDGRTTAFANVSRGIKGTYRDLQLGIVSKRFSGAIPFVAGQTIAITWDGIQGGPLSVSVPGPLSVAAFVALVNNVAPGYGTGRIAVDFGQYVGIVPAGPRMRVMAALSTGMNVLFGTTVDRTSGDIYSESVESAGGWSAISPSISKEDLDVVDVLDGYQVGSYGRLNYAPGSGVLHTLDRGFAPEVGVYGRVGARSLGTVRLYFLEPTSMEVTPESLFEVEAPGITLEYFPDPTLETVLVPAPPNGIKPKDLVGSVGGDTITSLSSSFITRRIRPGDKLVIDYQPITGTVVLPDAIADLALKTLVISIKGSPDTPIIFIGDTLTPGAVSREGIANQINGAVGYNICKIVTVGLNHFLEFETDVALVIRIDGSTALTSILFASAPSADLNNKAGLAGTYTIQSVAPTSLVLTTPLLGAVPSTSFSRQQFSISRPGLQRISSTQMSSQVAEVGLYYWDVELVSRGTGDLWNVTAGLRATPSRYRSDGYFLTTDDENLTFSEQEPLKIHFSRTVLQVGADDEPANYTQVSGQNVQINYDYTAIVASTQAFTSSDIERVVCASPLARHLLPHFVRLDLSYVGGSAPAVVQPDIERYITDRLADDALESSDLQKILSNSGATSISNPIDIIAVVHSIDRKVYIERSQNALTTGRLHAFVPERIQLKRRTI